MRLWRARRSSLRFLCLRIFFRRFLITFPTCELRSPYLFHARGHEFGQGRILIRRGEVNRRARAQARKGFGNAHPAATHASSRPIRRFNRWRRERKAFRG